MSGRDAILKRIRVSLDVPENDQAREAAFATRLREQPKGILPQKGKGTTEQQITAFIRQCKAVNSTVTRLSDYDQVPDELVKYLREHNLPQQLRHGTDTRLKALDWKSQPNLEHTTGPSDGNDLVGLSHAFGGVAETGTAILLAGVENPTTLNFLPETHLIIINAKEIVGDYETVLDRLRDKHGKAQLPRVVNMITGPSRSGDIEQTMLLGAHGPRSTHVIVVG